MYILIIAIDLIVVAVDGLHLAIPANPQRLIIAHLASLPPLLRSCHIAQVASLLRNLAHVLVLLVLHIGIHLLRCVLGALWPTAIASVPIVTTATGDATAMATTVNVTTATSPAIATSATTTTATNAAAATCTGYRYYN